MELPIKIHPPVPYERHVFVCVSGKTCPGRGGDEIGGRLKQMAKEAGIHKRIRVNKSGCLNQCRSGPIIVVYPEVVWYSGVTLEDVEEIFEKTVRNGEVIPRLLHSLPKNDEAHEEWPIENDETHE
jgi:(2Fe-2S) ferredoxin